MHDLTHDLAKKKRVFSRSEGCIPKTSKAGKPRGTGRARAGFMPRGVLWRGMTWRSMCGSSLASLVFGLFVLNAPIAQAESLNQALSSAYMSNPTLRAQRSQLRATDEEVARAKSGFRPNISGNGDINFQRSNTSPPAATDGKLYPKGYSVTLNQPIFRGLRTVNSVKEAKATVFAGREDLRDIEQQTLLNAVTAYMDVVRDQAIVRLRQNNVRVLSEQLRATKDRFDVGEVTKTDVAQAQARRSGAVSQLNLAQANLKASRSVYAQIIGHQARGVRQPVVAEHLLPRSLSQTVNKALAENPTLLAAIYREEASRYAIKRIKGELLPEVNLEASYQRRFDSSRFTNESETTTVTGRLTVPFYKQGEVSARVRQAKQVQIQRRQQVEEARARVNANAITAWSRMTAARAQIVSSQAQLRANRTALNGVREEEKVGQRTVLDVLDAEQELLDSQVTLETAKRDFVVAAYTLLQSVGILTAGDLRLRVKHYDPAKNYRRVKNKWFGVTVRHPDAPDYSSPSNYK